MIWHDMIFTPPPAVAPARDAADAPVVVVDRRDRTGHMRAVVGIGVVDLPLIVIDVDVRPVERRHVVDEVVTVEIAFRGVGIGPDIGLKIGMRELHGLVEHRHDDLSAALAFLPCVEEIDIGPLLRHEHLITRVIVVPLRRQQRIVHRHRGPRRSGGRMVQRTCGKAVFQARESCVFEHLDPPVAAQLSRHLAQGERLVEGDFIPQMQPERTVALLETGIGAEQRTDAPSTPTAASSSSAVAKPARVAGASASARASESATDGRNLTISRPATAPSASYNIFTSAARSPSGSAGSRSFVHAAAVRRTDNNRKILIIYGSCYNFQR